MEENTMFTHQSLQIVLLVWGCIFCIIGALGMLLSGSYEHQKRKTLFYMELFSAMLLGADALAYGFRGYPGPTGRWIVLISNFLVFALSNVVLMFFHSYVCCYLFNNEQKRKIIRIKLGYGVAAFGLLMVILSQFMHFYYYIDASNLYHRKPGFIISLLIPVIGMFIDLSLLVQYRKNIEKRMFWAMLSYIILPLVAAAIQLFLYGFTLINISICISMILMYMAATSEINKEINVALRQKEKAEERLEIEKTLNNCIKELSLEDDIYDSINHLLCTIDEYFQADRSYIFELLEDGKTLCNTHEYVKDGVTAQKDNLQDVPVDVISTWMEAFHKQESYFIADLEQERGSVTYDMLKTQQVERLLAVPLLKNGQILGFLGVDNPHKHYNDTTLLSSIQYFITNSLQAKKQKEQLQYLSYIDSLTQMYNRNKYVEVLHGQQKEPFEDTGAAYIDLNGLKAVNDKLGHEAGDEFIRRAAKVLLEVFGGQAFRIGGDEFVIICSHIDEAEFNEKMLELSNKMQQNNVSASVGRVWKKDHIDIAEMLKEADELMYKAKEEYHKRNSSIKA